MMARTEVLKWVKSLPADAKIAVSEGGLVMVTDGGDWLEIGGIPQYGSPGKGKWPVDL
jgi:hypothetical protein